MAYIMMAYGRMAYLLMALSLKCGAHWM